MRRYFLMVGGFLFAFFYILVYGIGAQPLSSYPCGEQVKPGTHAPLITHAFAVEKGRYGYSWKVYIEAEDPDGDMLRIASVVDQLGYGYYPTDWIYLKPQYQKHLKGYLQWNTISRGGGVREWTQISLRVSIFDKAGNESNVVIFPFTFLTGDWPNVKPPAPFDQEEIPRLGYIQIDLFDSGDDGKNRGR